MFENIRLSFQGIWSHKLRSFLTMLGIIIGIAAIIAIVSTIEGTNELIKQNMMGNNRHTVKVQLSQDDYTYEISTWNPSPEGVPLFDEDTRQEILQIPNVLRAAFYQVRSEYNSVVFYNNQSLSSCTVLGIDQYYFGTAGYQIMQGREIIQEDSKKKRQVAVIDESVLRTLFPDEDPIGKTIEIYGEPFTVVGVCTQVGQSELVINSEEEYWTYYQGGSSSGNIYIPKGVWGTIYKFDEAQNLVLQASGADEMAAAGKAAANIMNQNMNVSDSSITYRSEDLMQQAKQLQDMKIRVRIIELNRARCEHLSKILPDVTVINGDGTNRDLLMQEGLPHAESFVSLTNMDEENVFLSLFKRFFNHFVIVAGQLWILTFIFILQQRFLEICYVPWFTLYCDLEICVHGI